MSSKLATPAVTLQQVLAEQLDELCQQGLVNSYELRILSALKACRTATLGGHWQACDSCGEVKAHYNSCGNRHCPMCQGANRERWLLEREYDLFDVPHHHVTFTIPSQLRALFKLNEKLLYNLLFSCMWDTLLSFASDERSRLEAQIGTISILHTWTQKMEYHPHLHCIVPAGVLIADGKWKAASGKFLFSVKALSQVFRGKFCQGLRELKSRLKLSRGITKANFDWFLKQLKEKPWVVNSKPGFKGKESVLEYLGRYTHKIAVSNYRLLKLDQGQITFSYRDRAKGDVKRVMSLPVKEFLLRFKQHILPRGFVKIRHYGLFSTRVKKEKLALVRKALGQKQKQKLQKLSLQQVIEKTLQQNIYQCKSCKEGNLVIVKLLPPTRGSPSKPAVDTQLKRRIGH
ncbi:IS91 family transposase [Cesiribacter sp. SM1]|uniref:IS91 family transposase n=1 Tax=Cesiribacter sp. SM1 TaxID=2861196 RepID=UPI001CD3CE80|nr:IS91 family transposase [Cesiribacter sp. SM1]